MEFVVHKTERRISTWSSHHQCLYSTIIKILLELKWNVMLCESKYMFLNAESIFKCLIYNSTLPSWIRNILLLPYIYTIMYTSLLLLLLVYRHYLYYNSCFCIWVSHDFVRCSTCVNFTVVGHSSMGCKISESYNAHVDVTSLCNAVWTVWVPSTLVSCDRVCYVRRQSRNWRKETTLGELGADWKILLMWTLKK